MNESKYPKPLSFLLVLNLVALMGVLILTMDEIWEGVFFVIGIQIAAVVLGGACVALPSIKGKRKEMLDILGVVTIVPIITFLIPYLFAHKIVDWNPLNIRIFSMLTFYASAFPMIFFGLFVMREGWEENPKSAQVLFFMNLFFLLGVVGKLVTDRAVESGVFLGAIQFAAITTMLVFLRLPVLTGWRWPFFILGTVSFVGPVVLGTWQESHKVFYWTAIPLNLLALFLLRNKGLPDESRSRGGRLFVGLNMLAPVILLWIGYNLTRGGSRDQETLLLVSGALLVLGLVLLFPKRAIARKGENIKNLLPVSLLRETGAVSLLVGALMVSIVLLIADARRDERDWYIIMGFILLSLNSAYLFIRGFVLRWISDSTRLLLRRWTPRMGIALVLLLLAWVVNGWLAKRMWTQHKAAGEAEGWKYSMEDYIGEIPANEENFFMAMPFSVYMPQGMAPFDAFLWDELPEPEPIDLSDLPPGLTQGSIPPTGQPFAPGTMQPMPYPMMGFPPSMGMQGMTMMPLPMGTRREVDALLDRAPYFHRAVQSEILPNWEDIAGKLRNDPADGQRAQYFEAKPPNGLSDEELLQRYFGQFDTLLSALGRAAKRPKHYFPTRYENGPNTKLPHISKFKRMIKILEYSALAKLDRGDLGDAVEDIRLQFRVFEASGYGLFPISQLTHIACGAMIVETINKSLHTGKLTDAHLDELKQLLNLDKSYIGQMERALQAERVMYGPGFIAKMIEGVDIDSPFRKLEESLKWTSKRRLYRDLIYYDTTLKNYVTLIRQAKESGYIDLTKSEALFRPIKMETTLKGYIFSRTLLPSGSGSMKRVGALMNRFSAARMGLALEQYRFANGKLPDQLEALTPNYLSSLPKDAYNGKPLQWERSGPHRYRIPVSDRRGETWNYDPILAAIQLGDIEALEKMAGEGWEITTPEPGKEAQYEQLLKLGDNQPPNPYYLDAPESTALTQKEAIKLAIHSGHIDVVKWLIRHNLKPSQAELVTAVDLQRTDLLKLFLDGGVKPPLPIDPSKQRRQANNPYYRPPKLLSVFENTNTEILPFLLAKMPEDLLPKALEEDRPVSLLRKTLAKRDFAKARLLIEQGANVNHPETKTPGTPKSSSIGQGIPQRMMRTIGFDKGNWEQLTPLSQAARFGDLDFLKFLLKHGADINQRGREGSIPVHHAADNPDSSILKHLLGEKPVLTSVDLHSATYSAAIRGLLNNVKQLEQTGANLDEMEIVNAAFRSGNLDLIHHITLKANKPLSENEAWVRAMIELDNLIWPDGNPNSKLTDQDLAKIRNISKLLLENGLKSRYIHDAEDVANLTKEKLEADRY